MASADRSVVLIAAIDFGTTYSGYGFAFKSNPDDVIMSKDWGSSLGFQSYKTPTSLLVDKKGNFKEFGYAAENIYGQAIAGEDESTADTDSAKDMHLFKQFKMELHNKEKLDKSVKLKATDGYQMPALDVFALSLRYLKDHLINAVQGQITNAIEEKHVKWVLTVPAIWTEVAKTFMKAAAHKGGLISDVTSPNLLIALEPEAASLFCRTKDIDHFVANDSGHMTHKKPGPGDRYMVIDAGGGTMDITVHEIQSETSVKELFRASGGPWGGIYVDKELCHLFDELFGEEFMKTFGQIRPNLWMTMLIDWEKKKKIVSLESTKPIGLPLPAEFKSVYESVYKNKSIKECVQENSERLGVKLVQGQIRIDISTVKKMFDKVITPTIDHLRNLVAKPEVKNLSCIFLVGGFGESPILQERIKSEFENANRYVLVPLDASLCVIKGAVLFGQNPHSIAIRIARNTFCFKTTANFDKTKHDPKLKIKENPKKIRYLRKLVELDQELPLNFKESIKTRPISAESTSLKFEIFTASSKDVFDPCALDVRLLGEVKIEVPKAKIQDDRHVELMLQFGGTSISATAKHLKNGRTEAVDLALPD